VTTNRSQWQPTRQSTNFKKIIIALHLF